MKWTLNEPKKGDIVRIKFGSFYHYGIYVDDDEIIQFGLPPTDFKRDNSSVEVCVTSIEDFLNDKFLEVGECEKSERKKIFPVDEIVDRARKRIGEKGYHILYNNCEHFVYQCAFGEKVCSQVDEARQMWKNYPFVNVYVEKMPFSVKNNDVFPIERQKEIESCNNIEVKKEKYYDWKLLEQGIRHSLGLDIKEVKFGKNKSKWIAENFEFSLSHCEDVVAVVVARYPVGIDVERIDALRFSKFLPEKILSQDELGKFEHDGQFLNKIWTVKEALFKKGGYQGFNPRNINTLGKNCNTKILNVEGQKYYISIASDDLTFIKYHLGEGIYLE